MKGLLISLDMRWLAAATIGALSVGTLIRWWVLRDRSEEAVEDRRRSLKTWWAIVVTLTVVVLLGRTASILLLAVISAVSLHELAGLAGRSAQAEAEPRLWRIAYGLGALGYLAIWLGWRELFLGGLPIAAVIIFGAMMVVAGQSVGFPDSVARATWGLLLTMYCLAHAALLFSLPATSDSIAAAGGWFAFLLILTEANDIAQALIGRRFGRHKIVPRVSPGKSWEGFLGGILVTTPLAVLLAHWLTPFGVVEAVFAGVIIAVSGFFGDVNMSAIKRSAGVKDSSRLLPGHGGMLDRVDSLTFSAPAFYYFVLVTEGNGL